jgi:hypothetical protein
MSPHLISAIDKFKSDKTVDTSLSLDDFICSSYVKSPPCSYGANIAERLRTELNLTLDVERVSASLNLGDYKILSKYFEVKVSFLSSRNNSYNITHIRQWQRFNYYLICFIDCENDFTPNYYVIDKHIINKFRLTPMNGTPLSNSGNFNIEMRTTVKNNSEQIRILKNSNLLRDTSLQSLKSFLHSL